MKLLIPILALIVAPLRADNPGNYPGSVILMAANQVRATAGDRVCTITANQESIVISCINHATGQTLNTSANFMVGDCLTPGMFLSTNIQWVSICRLKNVSPGNFKFSFDVIANAAELSGNLFD